MLIEIDDWSFEADVNQTLDYSASELAEHCTCGYCLNYYETIDRSYPNLRIFLKQFGIEIEAPDELIPYDIGDNMYCDATYTISGKILQHGKNPIQIDGLDIQPRMQGETALCCHAPAPYFALWIGTMALPWVSNQNMILS